MSETAPQLNAQEMEELSALADGTLPAERRAAVEARVAASPELRRLLARQRRAVEAAKSRSMSHRPSRFVSGRGPGRGTRCPAQPNPADGPTPCVGGRHRRNGGGGPRAGAQRRPAGPSVADAARLAAQPAPGPPPAPLDHSRTKLAVAVDGAAFPDLRQSYGWRAVGERQDRIDGRDARSLPTRRATDRSAT